MTDCARKTRAKHRHPSPTDLITLERCFLEGRKAFEAKIISGVGYGTVWRIYKRLEAGERFAPKEPDNTAPARRASRFYKSDFIPT